MKHLTSQQRKLVYLAGILVLLIPIIWLGMPATGPAEAGPAGETSARGQSGGLLAQLRQEHDLGESTFGDVDPTSAAMNFVLLGLRGVATNMLWMQHEEYKQTKNWAEMRSVTDSIIMLQPHYLMVWRYNGWDLAYNVSSQWDSVPDRYYWVKEGTKFLIRGIDRNRDFTDLYFDTGTFVGQKVGRSDEWQFFRRYFNPNGYPEVSPKEKGDPDPMYKGGPDPELNPDGTDNYLAAKEWYRRANEVVKRRDQHIIAFELFVSYPARSQLNFAGVLNKEGSFGEVPAGEWAKAYTEWTEDYGRHRFPLDGGGEIFVEATEEDVKRLAEEYDREEYVFYRWLHSIQELSHYKYWRSRAQFESQLDTQQAHRELHEAEELFAEGEVSRAAEQFLAGLERFDKMLDLYGDLKVDDGMIEEALWSILLWQKSLQLQGKEVPDEFPLKSLWDKEIRRVPELQYRFTREFGGA